MKKNPVRRIALFLTAFAAIITATVWGIRYYTAYFSANVKVEHGQAYLYIPGDATFEQVLDSLRTMRVLRNEARFMQVAQWKKYPETIRPGRYKLTNGMNNRLLVNKLIAGLQEPLRLTISGNIRSNERLSAVLARYVEADSAGILAVLRDTALVSTYGFKPATVMGLFIPNTYEVYWTITPTALLQRMHKEYDSFWNAQRREKASTLGMSQQEVSTLASIVYEESLKNDEMPRIAGVYINRLKKKIPLQADPTLKYAAGDFTLKRVLDVHKFIDSPYNTYKYRGLPPGPICIPPPVAIDAVLNCEQHDYLYFCAKPDFSGYHNFSKTLTQHNQYADEYRRALNRNGIYR